MLTARKMIGETNPISSNPGTIRGDFGVDVGESLGEKVGRENENPSDSLSITSLNIK